MIEITPQRIEPGIPEPFVMRHPLRRFLHGRGLEFAAHHPPLLRARDQPRRLQHGEVFHEPRQRHAVRLREFGHSGAAAVQLRQHLAPRGIGQRGKHQVQLFVFIVNHLV